MPHLGKVLCATLAIGLLLDSGTAHARFGKRSSSASSSSGDKVHDATPVGSSDDDDDSSGSSSHGGSSHSSASDTVSTILDILRFAADTAEQVRYYEHIYDTYDASSDPAALEANDGHTPMYPYSYRPPVVEEQRQPDPAEGNRNRVMFRMGVEGQALGAGSAVGLNLGLEGKLLGVNGSLSSLTLPTDDGTPGKDEIGLYAAHLTLAILSGERGRLRAELGLAAASAPDITFAGPSLGVSFERCLVGALDLEGRAQLVPVPYLQLDTQAGLAVHLGVLTLRTGWRFLMLDDGGLVDGVAHQDSFSGPYAGLGLNI